MDLGTKLGRRAVVDFLASLFATGGLATAFRSEPGMRSRYDDEGWLTVGVMRFINTAESWHRLEAGTYVDWPRLVKSSAVARIAREEFTERMGIGRSLLGRMRIQGDEVISGWRLQLRVTEGAGGGSGYVATLSRVHEGPSTFAFASDEMGAIYGGTLKLMETVSLSSPVAVAQLPWVECAPLGELRLPKRRSLGTMIKRAALFTCDYYGCEYCAGGYCWCGGSDYPCCVFCEGGGGPRCSKSGGGDCCNCGCFVNCAWICCVG